MDVLGTGALEKAVVGTRVTVETGAAVDSGAGVEVQKDRPV